LKAERLLVRGRREPPVPLAATGKELKAED